MLPCSAQKATPFDSHCNSPKEEIKKVLTLSEPSLVSIYTKLGRWLPISSLGATFGFAKTQSRLTSSYQSVSWMNVKVKWSSVNWKKWNEHILMYIVRKQCGLWNHAQIQWKGSNDQLLNQCICKGTWNSQNCQFLWPIRGGTMSKGMDRAFPKWGVVLI